MPAPPPPRLPEPWSGYSRLTAAEAWAWTRPGGPNMVACVLAYEEQRQPRRDWLVAELRKLVERGVQTAAKPRETRLRAVRGG